MAALESSNSNIGHRLLRFRAGPTDDCEGPRSPSRGNEFGGKRRRQISGVCRQVSGLPKEQKRWQGRLKQRKMKFSCWILPQPS